jgi:ABC-type proline/glycine betaine transport system substrate-binding protein
MITQARLMSHFWLSLAWKSHWMMRVLFFDSFSQQSSAFPLKVKITYSAEPGEIYCSLNRWLGWPLGGSSVMTAPFLSELLATVRQRPDCLLTSST